MKTARLLIAALPLLFLAATSRHQAFGPIRFGIAYRDAQILTSQLRAKHHAESLTAAEARAQFVTNGVMKVSKMGGFDAACPVYLSFQAEPTLTQFSVMSKAYAASDYTANLKLTWADFQDIGDCKWARKTPAGQYPAIESLTATNQEAVTDSWEVEGVRIDLLVIYSDAGPATAATGGQPIPSHYNVALRATEIAPPAK